MTRLTETEEGHVHLVLRDIRGSLRTVIWHNHKGCLPDHLHDGHVVEATGIFGVYHHRGDLQLDARKVRVIDARGPLQRAFENTRTRLAAEGLLDPSRKRPIPPHPTCIGVITSAAGAALDDIRAAVRRRAPWIEIRHFPVRVRGHGAPRDIIMALDQIHQDPPVDLVILARGGGSVADLAAFSEEAVARAVARCPAPTVSAIGHEADWTITDLVADVRAPTPSLAAVLAVPDGASAGLLTAHAEALHPESLHRSGYVYVSGSDGLAPVRVGDVRTGDLLHLHASGGILRVRVEGREGQGSGSGGVCSSPPALSASAALERLEQITHELGRPGTDLPTRWCLGEEARVCAGLMRRALEDKSEPRGASPHGSELIGGEHGGR